MILLVLFNLEGKLARTLFFKKDSVAGEDFDFYPKQVQGHLLDSCGGTYTLTDNPRIRYFSTDIEYPDEYDGVDLKEVDEGYGFNSI